jgi:hypothetical protein
LVGPVDDLFAELFAGKHGPDAADQAAGLRAVLAVLVG